MWTKNALQDLIRTRLGEHRLIVVANREPYLHRFVNGGIECVPPASGMVRVKMKVEPASGRLSTFSAPPIPS